ncbi:MAG TPA: TIGR02679 family protein [Rhizobacter sp.]|nr:TIGR02679 family protein [Rhizobacter sp.]
MTTPAPPTDLDARLERLLGGPALAPLRLRLRRHFERRGDGDMGSTLQLTQLSAAEHEALALLTGRPAPYSRSARIDVARLDASLLSAGIASSLREALERLDGPIANRAALLAAAQAAWSAATDMPGDDARLQAWLQTPAASTLLKRLARQDAAAAQSLLERADTVLRRLPAAGIARAQLAAQTLGNAHALDAGQPIASIVLAAWRHAEGAASPQPEPTELDVAEETDSARLADERTRDIWSRAGVLVNELARPALVLNLPVFDPAAALWTLGEPAYLSLRQLLRAPPRWRVQGTLVFVCENPNLLAIAADRLSAHCAPLVCTDGMPAAAQRAVLTQLARAGAQLRYHGDFDWPGVQIANHVIRSWQAQPWRFAASDYEVATQNAPHTRRDLPASRVEATWDATLAPAMHRHGLAIAEEAVADPLIEDLRQM